MTGIKVIADAGGTSTHWSVISDSGASIADIKGAPANVTVISESAFIHAIEDAKVWLEKADEIYFYAAGCSGVEIKSAVTSVLRRFAPAARTIEADSDMLAVARALLLNNSGIACILGTGANSCLYDGKRIIKNIRPLGYILGDEGSGASIGKRFLRCLLRNELPVDISDKFFHENQTDYDSIISKVYRQPAANKYLASLTHFIYNNISVPEVRNIVLNEFAEFFECFILKYEKLQEQIQCCFSGSVAYYFKAELEDTARRFNVKINKIVASPIEGLIEYHLK